MNLLLSAMLLAQGALAPIFGAANWIGPRPDAATLAGKVVLVDVFTYSCINCKHVVPELRRLRAQYSSKDLVIVGVHTPELPSDRIRANVEENLALQGITWPVAIDNDNALWNAFGIEYWPTQIIFDRSGKRRTTIIGEGNDDQVAATIKTLVGKR
jgi:thiol-disulfide isomerase/thioredoxin